MLSYKHSCNISSVNSLRFAIISNTFGSYRRSFLCCRSVTYIQFVHKLRYSFGVISVKNDVVVAAGRFQQLRHGLVEPYNRLRTAKVGFVKVSF